MNIVEEITTAIDEKKVGVFIDLKKALLDHKILLSKLSLNGMRGMALG